MSSQKNDSVQDESFSPKFIKWPLDMGLEDDEFRAGYPFSSISPTSSDEDEEENPYTTTTNADIVWMKNLTSADGKTTKVASEIQVLSNEVFQGSVSSRQKESYSLTKNVGKNENDINTINKLANVDIVQGDDLNPKLLPCESMDEKPKEKQDAPIEKNDNYATEFISQTK